MIRLISLPLSLEAVMSSTHTDLNSIPNAHSVALAPERGTPEQSAAAEHRHLAVHWLDYARIPTLVLDTRSGFARPHG